MFELVRHILAAQLGVEEERITEQTLLVQELGIDSLDVVRLLMTLEDNHGIFIPDEALPGLKTVGDVVRAAEGKGAVTAR